MLLVEDVPLLEMDGLLIEQVFINLLENAFRFTRDDGTIVIKTKKEASMLQVTIRDDGRQPVHLTPIEYKLLSISW